MLDPQPIEQVGWGLVLSVASSALNGLLAWIMFRAARVHRSIALEADARHLVTDVWTSAGVVVGIALVMFTLIVGAALRRWEWLVGPWIASFFAGAGFYAFNHDVTDVPTSVTLLVALALFVAIGVALTVAAAIGVWFGRIWHGRQSAVRR